MTERERITRALSIWLNSLNELHSRELSSIGIDDMGDLGDDVPAFREWEERFWDLVADIREGRFAQP